MKLRIVSYAINGRGVGHLVRQLAILRWIRRLCSVLDITVETWVLTTSEADTLARREGVPAIKMPSKAMLRDAKINPVRYLRIARSWTLNAVASLSPDILIVDTFPSGSFGELLAVLEMVQTRVLVARRVRADFAADESYRSMLPFYHTVVHPDASGVGPILIREREELLSRKEARNALGVPHDARVLYLSLGGGGDVNASDLLPKMVQALLLKDAYIVVGAGPLYQGQEIRGDKVRWLTRYVPLELMRGFDAAISAGGYNSFHELMYAQVPTVFFPQARIADDQRERVMRAVDAGAGRYASSWQEAISLVDAPGDGDACRSLVEENGAKKAAIKILSTHVSGDLLEKASNIFSRETLLFLGRFSSHSMALELFRLFSSVRPNMKPGENIPQKERCDRLVQLFQGSGADLETFLYLAQSIAKKFPRATPDDLLQASESLFETWSSFDDWMGVSSLLRAIPTQRNFGVLRFAQAMKEWLAQEEDLFDALRVFMRIEGNGKQTVAAVLHHLTHGEGDA